MLASALTEQRITRGTITSLPSSDTCHLLQSNGSEIEICLPEAQTQLFSVGSSVAVIGNNEPLIVLEPEFLVDVTTVAECFAGTGVFPQTALLKRFEHRNVNVQALRGLLVNAVVDTLITNPNCPLDEAINSALAERSLSIAAAHAMGENVEELYPHVLSQMENVQRVLREWQDASVVVEPYVVSPVLGLQGRFDILVTTENGVSLVELKAGKAPKGIRANHAAQTALYEFLLTLKSAGQNVSSFVWYTADGSPRPLWQTPIHGMFSENAREDIISRAVAARNHIVYQEQRLRHRDFASIQELDAALSGKIGYGAEFATEFEAMYQQCSKVNRTLFQVWTSFVATETFETKVGNVVRSQADVWRKLPDEKTDSVLTDLRLDEEQSDFDKRHIVLKSTTPLLNTAIRVGDLILLHDNKHYDSFAFDVAKGWVVDLHPSGITISLRNKQFLLSELKDKQWTVEIDTSDTMLKTLSSTLLPILHVYDSNGMAKLGTAAPREFTSSYTCTNPEISQENRDVVTNACSCTDYFLIQGPPGTGKTSVVLNNIVQTLLTNPKERLLVVAYTNRAVDEICGVLQRELPMGSFLRHGSKSGSMAFYNHSIVGIAEHKSFTELADTISECRCIVTTVQSAQSSSELFVFGDFTTLVVDEASQILEAQLIGLSLSIPRLIMIGDHLQLPPVVSSPESELQIDAPLLHKLQLRSMNTSLFERLFKLCETRRWNHGIARLTRQGRMHIDIQNVVSNAFYNGMLEPLSDWQTSPAPAPWSAALKSRVMFCNVESANQRQAEVNRVVEIVSDVIAEHKKAAPQSPLPSIGVITPFRTQNRAISTALHKANVNDVTVDTVERFQGSQRDVIVFATSVSKVEELEKLSVTTLTHYGAVDRKLNVACSRARLQFVLVGNEKVLRNSLTYKTVIELIRNTT